MTVGLFRARLDVDDELLAELSATLSPDERERGGARQDERARRRFLADHGWRRRLLARQLGGDPRDVAYTVGPQGKPVPCLGSERAAGAAPHFNASRSRDIALYALSDSCEVGVDVEHVDPERDLARLARRILAPAERTALDRLPDSARALALYGCWTCKEAYLKALGTGLVFPLSTLELWTGDAEPVRHGDGVVRPVGLGPGLAAAIAVHAVDEVELGVMAVTELDATR